MHCNIGFGLERLEQEGVEPQFESAIPQGTSLSFPISNTLQQSEDVTPSPTALM